MEILSNSKTMLNFREHKPKKGDMIYAKLRDQQFIGIVVAAYGVRVIFEEVVTNISEGEKPNYFVDMDYFIFKWNLATKRQRQFFEAVKNGRL